MRVIRLSDQTVVNLEAVTVICGGYGEVLELWFPGDGEPLTLTMEESKILRRLLPSEEGGVLK